MVPTLAPAASSLLSQVNMHCDVMAEGNGSFEIQAEYDVNVLDSTMIPSLEDHTHFDPLFYLAVTLPQSMVRR
jgi:hypothetical protein